MKSHHWAALILVVGVGLDFLDEITGTTNSLGVVYGPTGFLNGLDMQLPAGLHVGTLLATVGAGMMIYHHTLP